MYPPQLQLMPLEIPREVRGGGTQEPTVLRKV